MPQVPYDPTPNVAPQANPTPLRSANAPADAFGANIARATEGLGKALEGAGNEIFARAISMQELNQQAEANEAIANYQMRLGESHADYHTSMGKNAVDGLNPFIKSTEDLRVEVGKGLSSDYARKVYDSATRNTRSRTIFSAASHAATENKRYVVGASEARIGAARSSALRDPTNEAQFQAELRETIDQTDFQADMIKGVSPEQRAEMQADARSKLWVNRIQGLAKEKPFDAGTLLDKAVADGDIRGEDIARITNYVTSQKNSVGARQISVRVRSGQSLEFGAKSVDIKQAQRAVSFVETGSLEGNYSALGPRVFDKFGNDRGRALGRYQVMPENLPSWLAQAGLPQMSPEEFLKSPAAQDQVFNTIFGGYMKKTGSFNEAVSLWFTGRSLDKAIAAGANDKYTTIQRYLKKANAALAQDAPLGEQIEVGKAEAARLAPNDLTLPDYVSQRIRTDHGISDAVRREDQLRNTNTISDAMQGNLSNGKIPTNVDELKSISPEVDAAYSNLPPPKQLQVQKNIESYNKAQLKITQKETADKLNGLAYGDADQVEEFINKNLFEEELSPRDIDFFTKLQRQLQKERGGSLEVRNALQQIQPMIDAASIDRKDKVLMTRLRGAYVDAVQDWHKNNPKKPLDRETANKIGAQLIQNITYHHGWLWNSKEPMFNLPLPPKLEEQLKEANPNITPAELEIARQQHVRDQFNQLQKSKQAAK